MDNTKESYWVTTDTSTSTDFEFSHVTVSVELLRKVLDQLDSESELAIEIEKLIQ